MKKENYIFTSKVNASLECLMKNEGEFVILMIHPQSNENSQKLFKTVTETLRLMGIKHQIKKGTRKVRVLNQEQIAAYENLRSGTFSQRYGYSNDKYLRNNDLIKIDEVF